MASAPLSLARRMLFGRKASAIAEAGAGLDGVVPPRRRPFRVLAIDGGGIRGILPAMVLADLERRTNRPIIDLFDMIAAPRPAAWSRWRSPVRARAGGRATLRATSSGSMPRRASACSRARSGTRSARSGT